MFGAQDDLTQTEPGTRLPLIIRPQHSELDVIDWVKHNREYVEDSLLKHGAILFRDFKMQSVDEFERFVLATVEKPMEYTHRSTPRRQVSENIYTSTEYPADQVIPLHNEMSYDRSWPMKLLLFCVKASERGGATPIADSRAVFKRIPSKIRECFIQRKVMYVRTYRPSIGLPWQEVFQTSSTTEVEAYCRQAGIEWEWRSDGALRTRQVCQPVARHPKTGEWVWFNQAHLFHVSNLPSAVRKLLLTEFGEGDLPRHAYYGDGSPIEPTVLEEIREAYRLEAISSPWQPGDLLLLDNMLVAHGREPYQGPRRIVVAMAEPYSLGLD